MTNDLNIPSSRKTMFAGMATLFLSVGMVQANPVSAGEGITEKLLLSQQAKVTVTGNGEEDCTGTGNRSKCSRKRNY